MINKMSNIKKIGKNIVTGRDVFILQVTNIDEFPEKIMLPIKYFGLLL